MKRKAIAGGVIQCLNIPRNWLHQGLTYMDRGERYSRVSLELLLLLILSSAFVAGRSPKSIEFGFIVAVCAMVVHTINWVFNGNFVALLLFAFPAARNRGEAVTCAYLNEMSDRLGKYRSVSGVLVYGSIARGEWHDRSDVDLRVLRRPGLLSLLVVVALTMRERLLAVISWQPIDMYIADDIMFLEGMRADELPVFLVKRDERLERRFPRAEPVTLQRLHK